MVDIVMNYRLLIKIKRAANIWECWLIVVQSGFLMKQGLSRIGLNKVHHSESSIYNRWMRTLLCISITNKND